MAHALFLGLGHRIVGFAGRGCSCCEGARHFENSPIIVVKLVARFRRTGSPMPDGKSGKSGMMLKHSWEASPFTVTGHRTTLHEPANLQVGRVRFSKR